MVILSLFILGLIVGSFLNCLVYRLAPRQIIGGGLGGRSFCPFCRHNLSWKDLIPVLSFIFLKGRCRYCQKRISIQYPLVELATAIVFVLVFGFCLPAVALAEAGHWDFLYLGYLLFISSCLIAIFVFDLKHYLIPDEIIYPAIAVVFLYRLFEIWKLGNWNLPALKGIYSPSGIGTWYLVLGNLAPLFKPLASAILAAAFFYAIYALSKGKAMGFGDVKLAFLMGLFLGFPKIAAALFFAFFAGALAGLGLMILKKKTLKSELPFAPFLVFGTFFALFFGQQVISYYLNFLLV